MYVVPSEPENDGIIIYIDLVLAMGWVDSPKFLCAFSDMLKDVANALVNTDLSVPVYGTITKIAATGLPPPQCAREPHPY